ncbi:hypothetical protein IJ843_08275 [bacterium]|nr:hypothetical protein [bacterium]
MTGLEAWKYRFITADGTSVYISQMGTMKDSGFSTSAITNQIGLIIYVDIDGPNKGSNTMGKDIFQLRYDVVNHQLKPFAQYNNLTKYLSVENFKKGILSAGWILDFDNMDYLKTSDGTTCPNGTKLTVNGNHSCK